VKKHPFALRLGFRQIDSFKEVWGLRIAKEREAGGPYRDVEELMRRASLPARAMRLLADADAFRSLGLDRREALWAVRRLPDDPALPLFQAAQARELGAERSMALPLMPLAEHVVADYQTVRLSLKGHPMQLLRPRFRREGVLSCAETEARPDAAFARTAGVVLVRQRPGTASGVVFMTLEDETGVANVIVWPKLFEKLRAIVIGARFVAVTGKYQNESGVIHIVAERIDDLTPLLSTISREGGAIDTLARADEIRRPQGPREKQPAPDLFGSADAPVRDVLPKGRNFQ